MSLGPGGAYRGPVISYQWRGDFASAEVEALHADGFGRAPAVHDWKAQVERHSLGWAHQAEQPARVLGCEGSGRPGCRKRRITPSWRLGCR